jgi:hypothetical protein
MSDTPAVSESLPDEVIERVAEALHNLFPRCAGDIERDVQHAAQMRATVTTLHAAQECALWLERHPDRLSIRFAERFRQRPRAKALDAARPTTLTLLDEASLERQVAEEKAINRLNDALRGELIPLTSRLQAVADEAVAAIAPGHVIRALAESLDALELSPPAVLLMLQGTQSALVETLRQSYAALNAYLEAQGLAWRPSREPGTGRPAARDDSGAAVLDYLQAAASRGGGAPAASPGRLLDQIALWHSALPSATLAPATDTPPTAGLLHALQSQSFVLGAAPFDRAVLDAVARLFDTILGEPDIGPRLKAAIARLQIPVLKAALATPAFFAEADHPARLLIDLLGQFSRRFPATDPAHDAALDAAEHAVDEVLQTFETDPASFTRAHAGLQAWLVEADGRAAARLAEDVARLEAIDQQETGTLLALETLRDLTTRLGAPESVIRRLEIYWVPYMASLYVAEKGEGPAWRSACQTLARLFDTLQTPEDEASHAARKAAIPGINAELRQGLLAQGATAEHLKDFFSAITAQQARWIRPDQPPPPEPAPSGALAADFARFARPATGEADEYTRQADALQEGDWVDFEPPHEGLATARIAWVGVRGYLLFCDNEGESRCSMDRETLASALREGRASVPDLSLTRKAMVRIRQTLPLD